MLAAAGEAVSKVPEFLGSFDTVLLTVTIAFSIMAYLLLSDSRKRNADLTQMLVDLKARLDAVPPAKPRSRARSK